MRWRRWTIHSSYPASGRNTRRWDRPRFRREWWRGYCGSESFASKIIGRECRTAYIQRRCTRRSRSPICTYINGGMEGITGLVREQVSSADVGTAKGVPPTCARSARCLSTQSVWEAIMPGNIPVLVTTPLNVCSWLYKVTCSFEPRVSCSCQTR